jgi:hypothetical protein
MMMTLTAYPCHGASRTADSAGGSSGKSSSRLNFSLPEPAKVGTAMAMKKEKHLQT